MEIPGYDVLVVGAGPGGVATAIGAARAGLRPLVVDAAAFPRDKTCGDGLTIDAVRILHGLGIDIGAEPGAEPVTDVLITSPAGRPVEVPLPAGATPVAATIPRLALDARLVARARELGLEVRDDCAVESLEVPGPADGPRGNADGEVVAHLADGTRVRAPWVVAADGHYSTVRRLVRPDDPVDLGSWHAARQYFSNVRERRLQVLFEPDLLPGYAWVFPLPGGRANVGYGVLRGPGRKGHELKALWPDLLARPSMRRALGPDAIPEDRVRAWPIPAVFDVDDLATGRVLFVGDAANVADPMTGEGIAQAMTSGLLAAGAIAHGGSAAHVREHYTLDVARELGRDLHFAWRLQKLVRSPRAMEWALRAVDATAWTRRNFGRWMFEDYPRALLLTPDRWRRAVGAGRPGR